MNEMIMPLIVLLPIVLGLTIPFVPLKGKKSLMIYIEAIVLVTSALAIMLLLNYAFNHINLNNIMLKVYSFNTGAIKAYEKCGFKIFGVWKNSHYFNGEYVDEIFMNVLKDDFYKNEKVKKLYK